MPNISRPRISVIVPCYKVERYLPTCIESILGQSYTCWELILVDDGSPDRCGAICDGYARKDDRIKVIHKSNGGLSSARNAGMKMMTGEYVTFVDSDDFLHPDALQTFVALAQEHGADIVQAGYVRGQETTFPEWKGVEKVTTYDNHTVFTSFTAKIIVCGKLYRAQLLDGITMPEGIINEDDWTTWKIYYRAKTIAVTNRPLYYYTVNPQSIMGQAKRKPDTTYYGAYDERIGFFAQRGEKDLEDVARLQFCKSLFLSYANDQLTDGQRNEIRRRFAENWEVLRTSQYVPRLYKVLFFAFSKQPLIVSKAAKLRGGGKSEGRISVIVPCYKVERYLPTCIESILTQSYRDWELILVDDGSPDKSGAICDEYARRDKRIRVIHQPNSGVAAARNAAVRIATGEYATFLDGDDFFHPNCLRDMLAIARRTNSDIVQCQYVRGNETTFPAMVTEEQIKTYTPNEAFVDDIAKIIVWGKLYRTQLLETITIPEGHYFEDDYVTWRWYYAAERIALTNRPYYYYTVNGESQMAQHKKKPNLSFMEIYDDRSEFFQTIEDVDLEACTHRQLCKALLLTYGNTLLTSEQRALVKKKYKESWKMLKQSHILSAKMRVLFGVFAAMPWMVTSALRAIKK